MTVTRAEREAFAERLKLAISHSRKRLSAPTTLANAFNLKWKGDPVTAQAAQKWLQGTATPALDKLEVLAEMLGVPFVWLRLGVAAPREAARGHASSGRLTAYAQLDKAHVTQEELRLLAKLRGMTEQRQERVRRLIGELALEQEMWQQN